MALGGLAAAAISAIAIASRTADSPDQIAKRECQTAFRVFSATEVTRFIDILEMLREGKTDAAIERIEEYELGITLAHLVIEDEMVDLRGDTTLILALERAREYRARHPRQHSDPETQAMIERVLAQPLRSPEQTPPAKTSDH
jgi:hypothetical protein